MNRHADHVSKVDARRTTKSLTVVDNSQLPPRVEMSCLDLDLRIRLGRLQCKCDDYAEDSMLMECSESIQTLSLVQTSIKSSFIMPIINIFVTSPDTHSERRIESTLTIQQLKVSQISVHIQPLTFFQDKLIPITGIQPQYQALRLFRSAEATDPLGVLDDENRTLEGYGVVDLNCIKVDNLNPNARPGEFSDLSAVDKFELTPEEYEARSGQFSLCYPVKSSELNLCV